MASCRTLAYMRHKAMLRYHCSYPIIATLPASMTEHNGCRLRATGRMPVLGTKKEAPAFADASERFGRIRS